MIRTIYLSKTRALKRAQTLAKASLVLAILSFTKTQKLDCVARACVCEQYMIMILVYYDVDVSCGGVGTS